MTRIVQDFFDNNHTSEHLAVEDPLSLTHNCKFHMTTTEKSKVETFNYVSLPSSDYAEHCFTIQDIDYR